MLRYRNMVHDLCNQFAVWENGILYHEMLKSEVIKLFFALSSAEHEICPANKSQITNNCKFFLNNGGHDNFSANEHENAN